MTLIGTIGATALYLLFIWLASAILASYLSDRKGYGEKPGLASGLLLSVIAIVIWLFYPARPGSVWRENGGIRRRRHGGPGG